MPIMTHSRYKSFIHLHALYFQGTSSIVSGVIMSSYTNLEGIAMPRILFVRDKKDNLQLPGGRVDPCGLGRQTGLHYDEDPLRALIGEIQEETNAVFTITSTVGRPYKETITVGSEHNSTTATINIYAFKVDATEVCEGAFESEFETCGVEWVDVAELIENRSVPQRYKITIFKMLKHMLR